MAGSRTGREKAGAEAPLVPFPGCKYSLLETPAVAENKMSEGKKENPVQADGFCQSVVSLFLMFRIIPTAEKETVFKGYTVCSHFEEKLLLIK